MASCKGARQDLVIAIPARNEESRIAACLASIGQQIDDAGRSVLPPIVIVLANNCSDGTVSVAQAVGRDLQLDLHCVELTLESERSTAGWARRLVMDEALRYTGSSGVIATTDADSRLQPHWVSRTRQHFAGGIDAVAGEIDWDPTDPAPELSPNRRLEARYAELAAELTALLDPIPHDPWPNHRWAWGASLAISAAAYRTVGGVPPVDLAEDRALQAQLIRHDLKVRHASDVRVWTSGRIQGRAPGGLADLIRTFANDEETLCDALLEPPLLVFNRAALRGRLRRAWTTNDPKTLERYISRASAWQDESGMAFDTFGALWGALEAAHTSLSPRRVHPRQLASFVGQIIRMIRHLRRRSADAQNV